MSDLSKSKRKFLNEVQLGPAGPWTPAMPAGPAGPCGPIGPAGAGGACAPAGAGRAGGTGRTIDPPAGVPAHRSRSATDGEERDNRKEQSAFHRPYLRLVVNCHLLRPHDFSAEDCFTMIC